MVPRAMALGGIYSSLVMLSNWFASNLLIVYNPFEEPVLHIGDSVIFLKEIVFPSKFS